MTAKDTELEKVINSITDTCIQIREIEIRKMEGLQKLILWIVGLSTGLQLFLFNTVSYSQTNGFTAVLFVISLMAFTYNAISGFYNRKTMNSVITIELSYQQKLNCQRVVLLAKLNTKSVEELINDSNSNRIALKIEDLEYYREQNPTIKTTVALVKKLSDNMESSVSVILITQFIAVALLLFMK